MKLNRMQERLIDELTEYAKTEYPEVTLKTVTESPADEEHVWVIAEGIDRNDDDRVMDFTEYLSLKQDDILVEYGYPISVMPLPMRG